MFATDRDLLAYEPALPREVDWAAQRLLDNASGLVGGGGTAIVLTGAINLATLGVLGGELVRVAGLWGEVTAVFPPSALGISRPRAAPTDPSIPLSSDGASPTDVRVLSFRPQIAVARAQVVSALGLDRDGLPDSSVLDAPAMARAVSLGALSLVYAGAAAIAASAADDPSRPSLAISAKAHAYADRFAAQLRTLSVRIDTNADGVAEEIRTTGHARASRAQSMRRA